MERDQREYKALAPVRYILDDADATLSKAEGQSGAYVAVLPAFESNRLMRDPEFAMRAQDAGLTPVLIDRVEEVIVDADRYAFDQPMLGIVFELSGAEASE
ncbi:hypothetical protein PFZ49_14160 [Microbacterium lacticum]|uniref:hypothetical protein n=1 Tax=Microbacterium lacticum TaxID=33885 RepID=UPI003A89F8DF